jgi:hypothetical protein
MQARAILLSTLFAVSTPAAVAHRQTQPQQPNRGNNVTTPSDKQEPFQLAGARSLIGKPRTVVVRDEKAFAALWAEHAKLYDGTVPPVPKVDFKKYDLVAVFLGSVPTGGHAVEIGEIKRDSKKAVIKVTHLKPGPGMMVTQAFTSPFAMKAVPKLPPTVTFDLTTTERK